MKIIKMAANSFMNEARQQGKEMALIILTEAHKVCKQEATKIDHTWLRLLLYLILTKSIR